MSAIGPTSQSASSQERPLLDAVPEREQLHSAFEMSASCQELLDVVQLIVQHSPELQDEASELLQQQLPVASCRMTWLKACFAPPGATPAPLRLLARATPQLRHILRVAGRQPPQWQRQAAAALNLLYFRTRFLQLPRDLAQLITTRIGRPLRRTSRTYLAAAPPLHCGLRAATTDSLLLLYDHLTHPLNPLPPSTDQPPALPPTHHRLREVTTLELHAPEWHKNGSWYLSQRTAAILPAFPRLAALLLAGADTLELTEEHLAPLRAIAPTLTRLHISCRAFQAPSTTVARHLRPLTALRSVTLWGCHWDGAAGKTEVVDALASLPDLHYLDVDISHAVPRGANELALQQGWLPRLAALSRLTHITVYPWMLPQREDGAPAAFRLPPDAWPVVRSVALDLRWRWRRAGHNYGAVRLDGAAVGELGGWLAARAGTLAALRIDADVRELGGAGAEGGGEGGGAGGGGRGGDAGSGSGSGGEDRPSSSSSSSSSSSASAGSGVAGARHINTRTAASGAAASARAPSPATAAMPNPAPATSTATSPTAATSPATPNTTPNTTSPATSPATSITTISPLPRNPGLAAMATLTLHDLHLCTRAPAAPPLLATLTTPRTLRRLRLSGGSCTPAALPLPSLAPTLRTLDVEVTLRELPGLLHAAGRLPHLRALRLQQGVDLGADGRTSSAPWPPQEALGALGRLTQLRALQVVAAWRLPLGVLQAVGRLGGLQHLGLEAHVQAVMPDEEGLDVQPLRALGALTGLVLKNCLDGVRSRELASVLCRLPALASLQMQQQPVMLPVLPGGVRALRLWGVGSLADIKSLRAAAARQGCLLEFGKCQLPDMFSDKIDSLVNGC